MNSTTESSRERGEALSDAGWLRDWAARELAWSRLLRLGMVTLQFVLLTAVIRFVNPETRAFENVLMLALLGFLVNHFLPLSWRIPFFATLSVASVLMTLGWEQGLWLLGIGATLIGLCHLPIPFGWRVGLLLVAAVVLAALRVNGIGVLATGGSLVPGAIWPILGAMFMFRLLVYLYDLKHATAPFSPWRSTAYFFMLPNVCFPLFPVVDYRTFCRNHYNDDPIQIYQVGAKWILRGIVQLLIYRYVYMYCMIAPEAVSTASEAGQYMLTTFLLYLKISGLFHLIIGLLHMYGFNLPETHHFYLLSSSFTDFWRRINIYWKDFIMKLVFYPLFFRLKKLSYMTDGRAMAVATLLAFGATWWFHSYQWYWIRGTFPVTWSDLVFWFGLGLVVLLNVQWEQRRGRQRTLKKVQRTWRSELKLGLTTAGTFAVICVLWTIWSTPDGMELAILGSALAKITLREVGLFAAVLVAAGVAGVLFGRKSREHTEGVRSAAVNQNSPFWRTAAWTTVGSAILLAVAARPGILLRVPGSTEVQSALVEFFGDLRERRFNPRDQEELLRGYYEDLGDVTRFNNELWQIYTHRPDGWTDAAVKRIREDALLHDFHPSLDVECWGARFTTNSHGLRDREYSQHKPDHVFRIALLGSSHDAGLGVATDETYKHLVEERLNQTWGSDRRAYEIVNFSINGYNALLKMAMLDRRALAFQPDLVLYAAHSQEINWTVQRGVIHTYWERGWVGEHPFVVEAMRQVGFDADGAPARRRVVEYKLLGQAPQIFRESLIRMRDQTRQQGAEFALLLTEHPSDTRRERSFDQMREIAESLSIPVIDLRGTYRQATKRSDYTLAAWNSHTNAAGHALMADKLYEQLIPSGLLPLEPTESNENP